MPDDFAWLDEQRTLWQLRPFLAVLQPPTHASTAVQQSRRDVRRRARSDMLTRACIFIPLFTRSAAASPRRAERERERERET